MTDEQLLSAFLTPPLIIPNAFYVTIYIHTFPLAESRFATCTLRRGFGSGNGQQNPIILQLESSTESARRNIVLGRTLSTADSEIDRN